MTDLKIEYVPIDILVPCPDNPRKNDENVQNIISSMEAFGWTNPILARRENKMVIAGHTRLKAAKASGIANVPVIFLDLDETDSRVYMLADNKLAERPEWDGLKLAELFAEFDQAGVNLALTGFEKAEIDDFVIGPTGIPGNQSLSEKYELVVECTSENKQKELYEELILRGYKCRVSIL